ncbi:MAG: dipeptide/oligopeptide/nickel ABC transporter ATP-binding protein [Propionibacteriaceae bacterium]|nr:dipeptide/oligopeptide/nickel ABC transporter ATP-binding protein [Propionibacteriaceae bacterium]
MLLEVNEVRKVFPGRHGLVEAVHETSLHIAAGECFGLIGESGSGKSTLAGMIAGTVVPTAGTVALEGRQLHASRGRSRRAHQRRLQMVFQDPRTSFNPRMRVADALREPLIYKLRRSAEEQWAAIHTILERVNLPEEILRRGLHAISVGQAQRVAIARALLAEPALIICDEITSALDVTVQASILDLLVQLRREQELSMLFISHDIAVVSQLADRIAVMKNGRILEQGPTQEVLANPADDYTKLLIDLA